MQNLKEIYYSSNLNPIPNPDLLFLSADMIYLSSLGGALGRLLEAQVDLGLLRLVTEAVPGKVLKGERVMIK